MASSNSTYIRIVFIFMLGMMSSHLLIAQKTINFQDSLGRKQGYWVYCGSDRPDSEISPDGKVEEGYYLDDRKDGLWIKYHQDGFSPKLVGNYENNRPKGNYKKFWGNGNLRETGCFEKNASYDSLKKYHENGCLEYEAWYNANGKEDGIVIFYYPNSVKESYYKVLNGVPVDTGYIYFSNGDQKEIVVYGKNGEVIKSTQLDPVHPLDILKQEVNSGIQPPKMPGTIGKDHLPSGYHKIFNDKGEIWLDGTFKDGVLKDGKEYVYDEDGILLKVRVYKSGSYCTDGK